MSERETHIKRLLSLASAVREAAKRLPDAPVSAEVVAGAGIMGMANWLEDIAALLRSEPVGDRDAEMFHRGWDAAKADVFPTVAEPGDVEALALRAILAADAVIGICDCIMSEGCGDPDPKRTWFAARDVALRALRTGTVGEGKP